MNNTIFSLDNHARQLAKDSMLIEGKLLEVLIILKKENAFIRLNYSGVFSYCTKALHLSEAQSYYFKAVVDASIKVPALQEAVTSGALSLS